MKKFLFTSLTLLSFNSLFAQPPLLINYQGVARNTDGTVIANRAISILASFLAGSPAGTVTYSESQSVTTNQFGIFSIQLGGGNILTGSFSAIPFSKSNIYLNIQLDPNGGSTYTDMGTQQLVSVPYALSAGSAATASGFKIPFIDSLSSDTTGIQIINKGLGSSISGISDSGAALNGYSVNGVGIAASNSTGASAFLASGATGLIVNGSGGLAQITNAGDPGSSAVQVFGKGTGLYAEADSNDRRTRNISRGFVGVAKSKSDTGINIGGFGVAFNSPYEDLGLEGFAEGNGQYEVGLVGATDSTGPRDYAGYFYGKVVDSGDLNVIGNLNVTGNLSKAGGTFKIDDPMDPANKYLEHSFVESPDMMNVYNGNIITDKNGESIIHLPSYFQAENIDFKYQLTVIGQFSQAIVEREISNNQFTIETDKPNVKVSWQVTGVRNDPWAQKNRVVAETDKKGEEKGHYLFPDLYGKSASLAMPTYQMPRMAVQDLKGIRMDNVYLGQLKASSQKMNDQLNRMMPKNVNINTPDKK